MDGISVHTSRVRAGECLAEAHPAEADIVIGVNSLGYLPAEKLYALAGNDVYCHARFTGEYPTVISCAMYIALHRGFRVNSIELYSLKLI